MLIDQNPEMLLIYSIVYCLSSVDLFWHCQKEKIDWGILPNTKFYWSSLQFQAVHPIKPSFSHSLLNPSRAVLLASQVLGAGIVHWVNCFNPGSLKQCSLLIWYHPYMSFFWTTCTCKLFSRWQSHLNCHSFHKQHHWVEIGAGAGVDDSYSGEPMAGRLSGRSKTSHPYIRLSHWILGSGVGYRQLKVILLN